MSAVSAKKIYDTMLGVGKKAGDHIASNISFGTVISINPISITRDGDDTRTPLLEELLVLSPLCKPFSIQTAIHSHAVPQNAAQAAGSHSHSYDSGTTGSAGEHTHAVPQVTTSTENATIIIWSGLSVGEKVILTSFNEGQRFFVERVEMK